MIVRLCASKNIEPYNHTNLSGYVSIFSYNKKRDYGGVRT